MAIHMTEAPRYVKRMSGKLRGRLILDSEIRRQVRARSVVPSDDVVEEWCDFAAHLAMEGARKSSTR